MAGGAAAALVLAGASAAIADNAVVDGDLATTNVQTTLALGNIACGETATREVGFWITRNGQGNVFANSAAVTVATSSSTTVASATGGEIQIPANWSGAANNTKSSEVTSTVSVTPTTAGAGGAAITYTASGPDADSSKGPATLSRTAILTVTWTAGSCATANTAPSAPGAPSASENPTQGGFTLTWAPSTDAEGDPFTYALEGKPTDGAWATVETGLTTNSYSFASGDPTEGSWAYRVQAVETSTNPALSSDWSEGSESVVVDRTAPVVELTCPEQSVVLGSDAVATWTASDVLSGIADGYDESGSVSLDTSTVGSRSASVDAGFVKDKAGNESEAASCSYSVIYDFDGFFRPVDMGETWNVAKAGSAIPIKFSLNGDQGLDVLAKTPTFTITGAAVDGGDLIETTVTSGKSSLSYDPTSDQYTYVWKTDKAWAGKSGTFTLTLNDGTDHTAQFSFKK